MYGIRDECYRHKRKQISVGPPDEENLKLPFLAYGFFKPRQLAYSQIKGYVYNKPKNVTIHHKLNHINGMPVLEHETDDRREVDAYIMEFKRGKEKKAYETIGLSKNKKIYRWEVINVDGKDANVLMNAGTKSFPTYTWKWNNYDWREDPIYENTLRYLDESIARLKIEFNDDENEKDNYMRFIEVQSLYMTLWSALDRFLSFRYGDHQSWNVKKLSEEDFFRKSLKKNYDALYEQRFYEEDSRNEDWRDTVFSAEDLTEFELSPHKAYALPYIIIP